MVASICIFCAAFAGWVAPHNPFDLATLELSDSMLPPAWMAGGQAKYLLGTDEQGRDVLSALMYGARISLLVGGASVLLSLLIGVTLGLVSGYFGGRIDALIMRICDVMLSFPSILIALLIAGVGRAMFPNANDTLAFGVLIIAIALPGWVQYARAVRGSAMVERNKEYVQAARVIGVSSLRIMGRHVLPNVLGPGARALDDPGRDSDPRRGDLVVSRRRRVADFAVAGDVHQRGQQAAVQRRLVAGHLSRARCW